MRKIPNGKTIEVHGWVMLDKLHEGRYRVWHAKFGDIECYKFTRPNGRKVLVMHCADRVDLSVKSPQDEDANKIVIE